MSDRRAHGAGTRLRFEVLESRALMAGDLSAPEGLWATPAATVESRAPFGPSVLTPAAVRGAFGVNRIVFGGGIVGDGEGMTIAIVDAYDNPNAEADLRVFSQTFGLPDPPSFKKVNQLGGSNLPREDVGWGTEIALVVQWAHAMAPKANILLVEAFSPLLTDLFAAVDYARRQPGVVVVSMSFGVPYEPGENGEFEDQGQFNDFFTTPAGHNNVSFVAATGDFGAYGSFPAYSPNVLAAGGTAVFPFQGGYGAETGWALGGGGISLVETQPTYQLGVQATGFRTIPDVSLGGDPLTGFAVYNTQPGLPLRERGWMSVGGTSASAPIWAGLIAVANQGRVLAGKTTLANVQSLVYQLPASDFNDIQTGNNGFFAGLGYDLVTGLGTPKAERVISHLVEMNNDGSVAPGVSPYRVDLTARSLAGQAVQLDWNINPLTLVDHFDIFRWDGSAYKRLDTVLASQFSLLTGGYTYLDMGLSKGTYQYMVRSVGSGGSADATYEVNVVDFQFGGASSGSAVRLGSRPPVYDTNGDGVVSPFDVLLVINQLNRPASARANNVAFGKLDVNRDGKVSPMDALMVINRLNRQPAATVSTAVPYSLNRVTYGLVFDDTLVGAGLPTAIPAAAGMPLLYGYSYDQFASLAWAASLDEMMLDVAGAKKKRGV